MLLQVFADKPMPRLVAAKLRDSVSQFKRYVPIISCLANPSLQERHWELISNRIEHRVNGKDFLSLHQVISWGIMDHMIEIKDIAIIAGKEWALHNALQAMKAEWGPLRFTCVPYKNTDTHIITGVVRACTGTA